MNPVMLATFAPDGGMSVLIDEIAELSGTRESRLESVVPPRRARYIEEPPPKMTVSLVRRGPVDPIFLEPGPGWLKVSDILGRETLEAPRVVLTGWPNVSVLKQGWSRQDLIAIYGLRMWDAVAAGKAPPEIASLVKDTIEQTFEFDILATDHRGLSGIEPLPSTRCGRPA